MAALHTKYSNVVSHYEKALRHHRRRHHQIVVITTSKPIIVIAIFITFSYSYPQCNQLPCTTHILGGLLSSDPLLLYNLHYFYYVCDCVCVCASVCMLLLLRIPNSRTNLVLPLQCILSIYVDFMLFYVILCCSPFSALFSHHQDDHYFGIYLVARSRQEPAGSQQ